MEKKEILENSFEKLKIAPIEKVILNEQIIEKFINLLKRIKDLHHVV